MNGILNILKPPGMTSFDVVAYLRGVLKIKKIGHTGTLDPEAVGVLPICLGNATKAIDFITDKDKSYRAEVTLGTETDTQDAGGKIVSIRDVNVTKEQFENALLLFEGDINQIPPMYSAVKIKGKKLYELARLGKTVERKPRKVHIYSLKCFGRISDTKYLIDIKCSKGTYIRTLCADIGEKLGCGAHMSFLARTDAGPFNIESSVTLEEIWNLSVNGNVEKKITSVEKVFEDLKTITLDSEQQKKFLNGVSADISCDSMNGETVRVYNKENIFFALGEIQRNDSGTRLKSRKLFLDN